MIISSIRMGVLFTISIVVLLIAFSTHIWANTTSLSGHSSDTSCRNIEQQNKQSKTIRLDRALVKKYENLSIRHIVIDVNKIFDETDPDENNRLYRFANRIQINTKEKVITDQLLFKEGDKVDLEDMEESMRILFNREYLLEAFLVITNVCDDTVDVKVKVRDAWVIEPRISFGREGGENSSSIGLRDGNFLGSGSEVALTFKRDADRSELIYRYSTHHFLGRRLNADFYHADLSDGTNSRIAIEKPFYSVKTPWSYGIETGETSLRFKTRFKDEIINEFRQITELDSIFVGKAISINRQHTHRVLLGYTNQDIVFSQVDNTTLLPDDELQRYPWVEFQRVTNRFEQYKNLSFIERAEDVAVGSQYRLRLGQGENLNGERIQRLIADYGNTVSLSANHLLRVNFSADIIKNKATGDDKDSLYGLKTTYSYFKNGQNKWHAQAEYSSGKNLSEFRQLTVGETTGLRGYPLSFQRGNQRYIINLERRYYSDSHWLNLIRIGGVIFIDFGRAWGSNEFEPTEHLQSAGVGLRFHSSKTGSPAVVHINVGAPINNDDTEDSFLLSLSVQSVF